MRTPGLSEFTVWAESRRPLMARVVHARFTERAEAARVAHARFTERAEAARVARYAEPLLASYGFVANLDSSQAPIARVADLYLSTDAPRLAEFYNALDQLHRVNGFTGPVGHCPALMAETARRRCEQELLREASTLFQVDFTQACADLRDQALTILLASAGVA